MGSSPQTLHNPLNACWVHHELVLVDVIAWALFGALGLPRLALFLGLVVVGAGGCIIGRGWVCIRLNNLLPTEIRGCFLTGVLLDPVSSIKLEFRGGFGSVFGRLSQATSVGALQRVAAKHLRVFGAEREVFSRGVVAFLVLWRFLGVLFRLSHL